MGRNNDFCPQRCDSSGSAKLVGSRPSRLIRSRRRRSFQRCRARGGPLPVIRLPKRLSLSRPLRISRIRDAAPYRVLRQPFAGTAGLTPGRRSAVENADLAPALKAASNALSRSGSLREGSPKDARPRRTPRQPACVSARKTASRGLARAHHRSRLPDQAW